MKAHPNLGAPSFAYPLKFIHKEVCIFLYRICFFHLIRLTYKKQFFVKC